MYANYDQDGEIGSVASRLIRGVAPGLKAVVKTAAPIIAAREQRKQAEADAALQASMAPAGGFFENIPWGTVAIVGGVGLIAFMWFRR